MNLCHQVRKVIYHKTKQLVFDELEEQDILNLLKTLVIDKTLNIQCRQKLAEAIIAQQN